MDGRLTATTGETRLTADTAERWVIGPDSIDVPRRFADGDAFAAFAEKHLNATVYRDTAGNVAAVGGRYEWSAGDRPAAGNAATDVPDRIAQALGGAEKQLTIGNQLVRFASDDADTTAFSPFSTTREHCVGRHCIEGTSWVTNLVFYHSVGTRTKQTSGGTDYVQRPCCRSGELVRGNGDNRCRLKRPGAWTYDRNLGRLVPTGPEPYDYTPAQSCRSETLRNQLGVRATLIDRRSPEPMVVATVGRNTREVEIGEWLVTIGLDLGGSDIGDIDGVCGTHTSSRGESVRTAEGYTGEHASLCP